MRLTRRRPHVCSSMSYQRWVVSGPDRPCSWYYMVYCWFDNESPPTSSSAGGVCGRAEGGIPLTLFGQVSASPGSFLLLACTRGPTIDLNASRGDLCPVGPYILGILQWDDTKSFNRRIQFLMPWIFSDTAVFHGEGSGSDEVE